MFSDLIAKNVVSFVSNRFKCTASVYRQMTDELMHRGAFCQFPFRWIYYYGSNKFTGKETGKTHLCVMFKSVISTQSKSSKVDEFKNDRQFWQLNGELHTNYR